MIYLVPPEKDGYTVLTILRRELELSASLVRRLKRCQGIYVNGEKVYTNHILRPADKLEADITLAEPECGVVPEKGELDILWESDGLLAVNKPAGMLVHPSRARYMGTLANIVAGYFGGACHAVNRLDRDTSGVVLFAQNSYYKERAAHALKTADKHYTALVHGKMPETSGVITLPIKRLREMDMLRIVAEDGQRAVTHYEVLESGEVSGESVSLLRLRLETGRTHQIRVHLLAYGCPILGDTLYHTDRSKKLSAKFSLNAQLLHASRLEFDYGKKPDRICLFAPITRQDMQKTAKMAGFFLT